MKPRLGFEPKFPLCWRCPYHSVDQTQGVFQLRRSWHKLTFEINAGPEIRTPKAIKDLPILLNIFMLKPFLLLEMRLPIPPDRQKWLWGISKPQSFPYEGTARPSCCIAIMNFCNIPSRMKGDVSDLLLEFSRL